MIDDAKCKLIITSLNTDSTYLSLEDEIKGVVEVKLAIVNARRNWVRPMTREVLSESICVYTG